MSALLDWANTLQGPAGILIGVVGSRLLSRKKDSAEASQVIATTAITLIAPLQAEITKLSLRVDTLETENAATKTKLTLAIEHIRALRAWISSHIPNGSPPQAPADLRI